jgi:cell division protein FtsQ
MKKWHKITLGIILIVGTTSLLAFVSTQPTKINCYNVQVKINGDPEAMFLTEDEIMTRFQTFCTDGNADNKRLDLKAIEANINEIPSISSSDIYKNVNGTIHIEIELKKVIGRIVNKTGNSYYIDSKGVMMPIIEGKPARVCIVNGEIFEEYNPTPYYLGNDSLAKQSIIDDVYNLLSYINKKPFWKAQIEQIYVTPEKKFILIPKAGTHEIMFGNAEHIDGIFKKL